MKTNTQTNTPKFENREAWYTALATQLLEDHMLPELEAQGGQLAAMAIEFKAFDRGYPFRISCAAPYGLERSRGKIAGMCYSRNASNDGVNEVFINATLETPLHIGETIVHELVHAIDDNKNGHGPVFKHIATTVGLAGKMTETTAGPELAELIEDLAKDLGPLPAASMKSTARRKPKQSTRMIKFTCNNCGFIGRTTAKHINNMRIGAQCPCCDGILVVPEFNITHEDENMTPNFNRTAQKMTATQKRKTRAKCRAEGIDPNGISQAEFVKLAKQWGFLNDNTEALEDEQTAAMDNPDAATADDEHEHNDADAETMVPGDAEGDGDGDDEDDEEKPGAAAEGDSDDEDADGDQAEGEDDDTESPEIDPPTNPMDQMIDERITQHIAKHIHDDEHRLPSPQVKGMIKSAVKRALATMPVPTAGPQTITIKINNREAKDLEGQYFHKRFEAALKVVSRPGRNLYLVDDQKGGPGSGKTHIGKQMADALGLDFYYVPKIDDIFAITGFKDANGEYQATDTYRAFTEGGLIMYDEMDRYGPEAFVGLNAITANRRYAFPDGKGVQEAHPDLVIVGAGNTMGNGHDRVFTAAQALDASSMTRFVKLAVEYDEELERKIALEINPACSKWVDFILSARANKQRAGLDVLVTPRETYHGASLLADGFTLGDVKEMTIFAGLNDTDRATLSRKAK